LTLLARYDQVLTGVLPYSGSEEADVIDNIRFGKPPPRPTDPSQNLWLQDPIWDTIVTCWTNKPERRCKLSVVYHVFLASSPQDAQNVKPDKPGDLNVQNSRTLTIVRGLT
jgi:hypothetical protein